MGVPKKRDDYVNRGPARQPEILLIGPLFLVLLLFVEFRLEVGGNYRGPEG